MNSKNLYFNLEQQQSKYWSENSVKTGQSPKKILLERSLNDMFLKEVMILFHAKREKKAEKEDQTQAGQTSRSATEVQSLPPKKSQVPPKKNSRCWTGNNHFFTRCRLSEHSSIRRHQMQPWKEES